MKLQLTQKEKDDLLPKIQQVIDTGKLWEDKQLHHPAGAIIAAILEISGMEKDTSDEEKSDGFDRNGWQWDWWQDFTYNGRIYVLSGSGYHGGHRFSLADE